jgi:transcriptional regulator with XRE-family HTH domain
MKGLRRVPEIDEIVDRIRKKMKPWGITVSYLAEFLGVSRQYVWQVVHYRGLISRTKALEIEKSVDRIIDERAHVRTFGDRLRAARISAGFTLKQVASMIGYTWVGVERWEKNQCLPKPGVLWHLCNLYCISEDWFRDVLSNDGSTRPVKFQYERSMGVRGELAAMYLSPAGSVPGAMPSRPNQSSPEFGRPQHRRTNRPVKADSSH